MLGAAWMVAVSGLMNPSRSLAQPAPAAKPKFKAAWVKPCGDSSADRKTGEVFSGRRVADGGGSSSSGRLRLGCWTVKELVLSAYVRYTNGLDRSDLSVGSMPIEGGPAWINYDRYTIEAESEGAPGQEMMRGPMMQAFLEDRFRLKIRRETREVPVYELAVAEGGPKLQPSAAKTSSNRLHTELKIITVEAQAIGLGEFSWLLSSRYAGLGRPVIDKTGIAGLFDFRLVYARDGIRPGLGAGAGPASPARSVSVVVRCNASNVCEGTSRVGGAPDTGGPDASAAPSIFTALQQLGLKLEQTKGPGEFLVIDSVERPFGN